MAVFHDIGRIRPVLVTFGLQGNHRCELTSAMGVVHTSRHLDGQVGRLARTLTLTPGTLRAAGRRETQAKPICLVSVP